MHALGQLSPNVHYGAFLRAVWHAVLSTHEDLSYTQTLSQKSGDAYTDIKYRSLLEAQLRCTLVHVISSTDIEDLFELGQYLVQKAPILMEMLKPVAGRLVFHPCCLHLT